ncbi:MAG: hypothetical protein GXP25_04800 [Planctomycetes bacterium]|nr:hypothetical protein [Planctomycetota bacterium]
MLSDPLLDRFPPSERRAILVHKYFLGIELAVDPGLPAAIKSWEKSYAQAWRERKMEADIKAQFREIEKHKYWLSEKAGGDVGWEYAVRDWIGAHASGWREWREQQPESGA